LVVGTLIAHPVRELLVVERRWHTTVPLSRPEAAQRLVHLVPPRIQHIPREPDGRETTNTIGAQHLAATEGALIVHPLGEGRICIGARNIAVAILVAKRAQFISWMISARGASCSCMA